MQRDNLFTNPWVALGLPALTLLFGIQILRALFPYLLYVLGDARGWTAVGIGALALIIFGSSFLAEAWRRLVGGRVLLIITVLGVSFSRLALQFWPDLPLFHLIFSVVGTICLTLFFPVYLATIRPRPAMEMAKFGLGLQIGILLTVAINGLYNTYDLTWQSGLLNGLLVVIVAFLQLGCLAGMLYQLPSIHEAEDPPLNQALLWTAFGAILFLQLLIFANVAQLTAVILWSFPAAFTLALFTAVVGLGGVFYAYYPGVHPLVWVLEIIILLVALIGYANSAFTTIVALIIGQFVLGEGLMLVVLNLRTGSGRDSIRNLTIGNGLGMLLFAIFIFLYYAGYQIRLPFPNTALVFTAVLLIFLCGFFANRSLRRQDSVKEPILMRSLALLLLAVVIVAAVKFFTWNTPTPITPTSNPTQVMTYNLHNGVNPQGQLDLEAIAQAIENQNPDVVSLQEVSRGWVVNGSVDMLIWLSQRLDMPVIWGPTEGELWGNAVLSRYPVIQSENRPLPPNDLLLHRGFIWAEIETGTEPLQIIDTHFHHITADNPIRVQQSQAILDFWQDRPHTLLMGDLNAPPDSPEMMMLQTAGFNDAIATSGIAPGYTFISTNPTIQLDYIWYTSDLSATAVAIPPSTASDHLSIATTITKE
ncbi:MAG: hypothetical protein GY796_33940 [Chloroflexi bacterium]|nr:hypothetical protein [Chloroflexota bacterium]